MTSSCPVCTNPMGPDARELDLAEERLLVCGACYAWGYLRTAETFAKYRNLGYAWARIAGARNAAATQQGRPCPCPGAEYPYGSKCREYPYGEEPS